MSTPGDGRDRHPKYEVERTLIITSSPKIPLDVCAYVHTVQCCSAAIGSFSSESNRASDTELRPILSEWRES